MKKKGFSMQRFSLIFIEKTFINNTWPIIADEKWIQFCNPNYGSLFEAHKIDSRFKKDGYACGSYDFRLLYRSKRNTRLSTDRKRS